MITTVGASAASLDDRGSVRGVYLWFTAAAGALGGLLFGYDWVVIGGAKPFYERFFHLNSPALQGWAMSCALIGCLIGAVSSGSLSNRFGRRRLLTLAAVAFAASSLGTGLAHSFTAFVVWRIFGGYAIGLASGSRPCTSPRFPRRASGAGWSLSIRWPSSSGYCGAGSELADRASRPAGCFDERDPELLERAGRMAVDVRGNRDSIAALSAGFSACT